MDVKSLSLGSAMAFVVISGAQAADAVVAAEPEPAEFVRVCDVYGSGFFYAPGTETCLKVSGYVRVDIRGGFRELAVIGKTGDDTFDNRARFQLRTDARTETELGTLRAYSELNFNYEGEDWTTQVAVVSPAGKVHYVDRYKYDNVDTFGWDHIYLELGGFRIGKTDSLFSTFTDYSSGVMNDGEVPYGPFGTLQAAYTFTAPNGFSAAIALEQGDEDEGGITYDYLPFVTGGVSLTRDWGKIGLVAGYDTAEEEVAVKGRLDVKLSDTSSVFVMGAFDSGGDVGDDDDSGANFYAPWEGDWAVWGGAAIAINEKATFNAEIGYDDFENFSAVVNVAYTLVPGLEITPEVVYIDNFGEDKSDGWLTNIRFQRNF